MLSVKWISWPSLLIFFFALALLPFAVGRGLLTLLYLILYFTLLATSWNILSGFTGYLNFGHAAFAGIGMYASTIAIVDFGIWWPLAFLVGGFFAAFYAALLGFPVLRIKGPYFAITMLAVSEGTRILMGLPYLEPITRAGSGIPFLAGIGFKTTYYSLFLVTFLCILVTYRIGTSQWGLQLLAIREDEQAAENIGINTTKMKILAFILSAFFAGLGGSIHATYLHYIDPLNAFYLRFTLLPAIMVFFGGLGTILGPLLGSTILTIVDDFLWSHLLRLNMAAMGFFLVLLILFLPQGIIGWAKEQGLLPKAREI